MKMSREEKLYESLRDIYSRPCPNTTSPALEEIGILLLSIPPVVIGLLFVYICNPFDVVNRYDLPPLPVDFVLSLPSFVALSLLSLPIVTLAMCSSRTPALGSRESYWDEYSREQEKRGDDLANQTEVPQFRDVHPALLTTS